MTRPASPPPGRHLAPGEALLLLAVLALALLAALGPHLALPAHYHDFADQRSAFGLPCAMDVLSNLAFVLAGVAGLRQMRQLPAGALGAAQRRLVTLFLVGLLLTAVGSAIYHWRPDDAGLALDRAGMSVAFAGMLGLAVADRLSARAGLVLAGLTLPLAWLSAGLPLLSGNMAPWAVLQAGGALLLLALAGRRPLPGASGVSLAAVIAVYALAKVLELADQPVFALTQGLISGHSLKHAVAAAAVWPLCHALGRADGHNRAQAAAPSPGLPPRPVA